MHTTLMSDRPAAAAAPSATRPSGTPTPRPAAGARGADRHPGGRRPGGRGAGRHPAEADAMRVGLEHRGLAEHRGRLEHRGLAEHRGRIEHPGVERRVTTAARSRGRVVAGRGSTERVGGGRVGAGRGGAGRVGPGRVACADAVVVPVRGTAVSSVHRRRRTTAVAVMTGVALAMLVWIVAIVGSDYQRATVPSPVSTQVVHVRAGESLGSIAARVAPDMPSRVVIDEIVELNDMAGSGLQVGQALLTPRYR